jgi:dethiobiotin synthetase
LFITGTDTGVGKTLIAGAIARSLSCGAASGVEVFKPVASGCRQVSGMLISEDTEFLAWAVDSSRTLGEITPVRYREPAAPNVAAEHSGRGINLRAIFDQYTQMVESPHCQAIIVEGVGGLLCPISDQLWVIHLARLMNLPLVIVAHATLGTINHTLLTIHAARSAGLRIAGVVVNRYQNIPTAGQGVLAMETNPQQIAKLGQVPVLCMVPDERANSVPDAAIGPDTQFVINQVDWDKLMEASRP